MIELTDVLLPCSAFVAGIVVSHAAQTIRARRLRRSLKPPRSDKRAAAFAEKMARGRLYHHSRAVELESRR